MNTDNNLADLHPSRVTVQNTFSWLSIEYLGRVPEERLMNSILH